MAASEWGWRQCQARPWWALWGVWRMHVGKVCDGGNMFHWPLVKTGPIITESLKVGWGCSKESGLECGGFLVDQHCSLLFITKGEERGKG